MNKEEKLKVMDMLYKYKEAFSLRDKIGTCPNIKVEIEITDKSPFFIIQGGKPKLIAYASKRLPKAAKNYSITELELCGLAINIASFAHLLKRVDFDAIVDHLAL